MKGIVRGYRGYGLSGLGAVVVEIRSNTKIPTSLCFRKVGPIIRCSDNRTIKHAVECIGDWRPCRNIADSLLDQPVEVGLGELGLFPAFTRR